MTDEQMFNLSDEEIERPFLEARAQDNSPETDIENVEYDSEETIDLAQPEMDSDDDLVVDDVADTEIEADSEEIEGTPDEGPEVTEEQTEENDEEVAPDVTETPVHKFKANGKEYTFTPEEMMSQFPKIFGQAMDYTKKTQAMKPWRKTIDAIEQAELGHEDINLMIDVMKGKKEAIAEVLKRTGVDSVEIDTENSKYTPNDYGRDDKALAIKDIVEEISADKEYEITHRVLSKEGDEKSFRDMTEDPELIRLLHVDVKTGIFDKVQPIADKIKVLDRGSKSDLEYYRMASIELAQQQRMSDQRAYELERQKQEREAKLAKQVEIDRVKKIQEKQKEVEVKAVERKAATPTSRKVPTSKVVDYLDTSDEAFEDWY